MKSLVVFFGVFCAFEFTYADSYMEAYKNLQNEKLDEAVSKKDIDREFQTNDYAPPYPYGPPAQAPQYGAPYPPVPNYGPPNPAPPPPPPPPPQPMYGPPPVYGAPSSVQVFYGAPHALGSIWEKIKWKLDLFTIGKLLLKLVLFKKFVSWVALLCLLFIIPTLKNKFESFGAGVGGGGLGGIGGERSFNRTDNEDLDQIFNNISKALEKFSFRDKSIDDKMSKITR